MVALFCLILALLASPFKSKSRLEAENAALRHQLIILRRKVRDRVRLTNRLAPEPLVRWTEPASAVKQAVRTACVEPQYPIPG